MRFKVNSRASNVVVGFGLVPAIGLLAAAFMLFERGDAGLGAGCAIGFLAVITASGLVARRLSREIEVTNDAIREHRRNGTVTEIRWREPHVFHHDRGVVRHKGIAVTGHTRVRVEGGGRTIAFAATTSAGMMAFAAKHGAREVASADAAIAQMIELSRAGSG